MRQNLKEERGTNLLDSGSHFYDAYETKDGKYISVGSLDPQFYATDGFFQLARVQRGTDPRLQDQDEG